MQHKRTLFLLCPFLFFTTVTSTDNVCVRPELEDNIEMKGLQRYFNPGTELVLACKHGYTPMLGPRKIVCGESGKWTPTSLFCTPKRCPTPLLSDGAFHLVDTVYQSTINYTCHEGYILTGPSSAVCQANGTWSGPVPQCNPVTCGLAPIPKYGLVVYSRRIRGNTTEYGTRVAYKCLPPYAVIGAETATCTESGTWSKTPECQVVTCPPPGNITNGYISNKDRRDFEFMETVKYGCYRNYMLLGNIEIVCQKNGKWSEKPTCVHRLG